ncbi:hypothetical protein RJT34_13481 [Clitoria ternatea]|uniref:Uncharacterized protein n=1 Tax=Clitoria ternatea TaxID=43366 RepID=A0AAN9JS61_CLITE
MVHLEEAERDMAVKYYNGFEIVALPDSNDEADDRDEGTSIPKLGLTSETRFAGAIEQREGQEELPGAGP